MRQLRYIEIKTGFHHDGPAWIAYVEYSRSGATVYFNNRALIRCRGAAGNHLDIETRQEYWISGVKKDGKDRHSGNSAAVAVDSTAVAEYLKLRGLDRLDPRAHPIVGIPPTDVGRLTGIQNAALSM